MCHITIAKSPVRVFNNIYRNNSKKIVDRITDNSGEWRGDSRENEPRLTSSESNKKKSSESN